MSRRPSYSQQVFPAAVEFTACLKQLQGDGVKVMLGYVWEGFDRFKAEVLDKNPPPSRDNPDLERDLTEMLYPHILKALPASPPYYLQHEKKERESAVPGRQPPEPDLSFVLFSNIRVTFPMDSKVVERDGVANMSDYVDTVTNRFVSCVYGPFSKEGAVLAFLLAGSVRTLFRSLSQALGCAVSRTAYIKTRHHKTSWHERPAPACKLKRFRCHHLVMPMCASVIA
jgi:hypothetical protein